MTEVQSPPRGRGQARRRLRRRLRLRAPARRALSRSAPSATPAGPAASSGSIPASQTFYVFLSNRVHPDGKGSVVALQQQLGTLVAESIAGVTLRAASRGGVGFVTGGADAQNGIDVLHASGYAGAARQAHRPDHEPHRHRPRRQPDDRPAAQRAGRDARGAVQPRARHPRQRRREGRRRRRRGHRPADLQPLRRAPQADARAARRTSTRWSSTSRTSAPLLHLHLDDGPGDGGRGGGEDRRSSCSTAPTRSAATSSRGRCSKGQTDFVGWHPLPVRHGMTVGELAELFRRRARDRRRSHRRSPVKGWKREQWQDEAGLPWVEHLAEHALARRRRALPRRRPAGARDLRRPRHRRRRSRSRRALHRRRARSPAKSARCPAWPSSRCASRPRASTHARRAVRRPAPHHHRPPRAALGRGRPRASPPRCGGCIGEKFEVEKMWRLLRNREAMERIRRGTVRNFEFRMKNGQSRRMLIRNARILHAPRPDENRRGARFECRVKSAEIRISQLCIRTLNLCTLS